MPGLGIIPHYLKLWFGIDYNIFLMTRVREEALQIGTRRGVLRGLTVTGGVITSAGVVLAATFSALAVIPLIFLAQIAFIVAFGVLLDALIVRTLLVPALVYDIGRPVWWPSALANKEDVPEDDELVEAGPRQDSESPDSSYRTAERSRPSEPGPFER